MILRHYFRDLDIYYTKPCVSEPGRPAKHAIRERLAKMLYDYRTHDIFLIAHSMGSIVAYDVLTWSEPRVNIHSWATLGSPLGLPTVMMKILVEQNLDPRKGAKGKTPDSILRNWYNMSDPEDRVALRHQLADEFTENLHGVGPVDLMVTNDYSYGGQTNPHKSYGYLRTPEMAGAICSFIDAGLPRPMVWLKQKFNQWLDRRRLAKERIK
jgi:hypothetical protein